MNTVILSGYTFKGRHNLEQLGAVLNRFMQTKFKQGQQSPYRLNRIGDRVSERGFHITLPCPTAVCQDPVDVHPSSRWPHLRHDQATHHEAPAEEALPPLLKNSHCPLHVPGGESGPIGAAQGPAKASARVSPASISPPDPTDCCSSRQSASAYPLQTATGCFALGYATIGYDLLQYRRRVRRTAKR